MDSPEKPGIIGYTRKRMKTNKTKSTTQKTDEQHGYHQAWFTFSHGIHMLRVYTFYRNTLVLKLVIV